MTDATDSSLTRRRFAALAAAGLAGLAGCADGDETSADEQETDAESDGADDGEPDADSGTDALDPDEIDGPETPPEWAHAEFRAWLLDEGPTEDGNRRFDYTETIPEGFGADLPSYFDVSQATVDGHLVQGFTQVFLGEFDADATIAGADDADSFTLADEYEGYAVLEPDGDGPPAAVGPNALVIGTDYEQRIDARYGERERLEEAEPDFERLFAELPHENTISGQYDSPAGGDVDIDEIALWGVSSPEPMADSMTWVFVFEDEATLTEDALADLETVSGGVEDSEIDGRIARVVGAPPDLSGASESA